MPPVTVHVSNNFNAFQAIIQGKNVSEVKRILVLIETVTSVISRHWKRGCVPFCRATKHEAESDLLAALTAGDSMDEIRQALRHYKQQLNNIQRRIHMEGNTFMRGVGLLVDLPSFLEQSSSLEKLSKAADESIKLPVMEPEVYQQESGQYGDKNPLLSDISGTSRSPANIPASICVDIINIMEKAGYCPEKSGICYGIAWTALLACVREDGQAHMERMQYLAQMDTSPLLGTDDIHQVYPFFDAVILSMTSYKDMSGYEKGIGYPGRQEVAFPGRIIGGDESGYEVLVVKHTFIAEFTSETVIRFLQQTRENNKGITFGLMIHYLQHCTSVGFDGTKWLAVDHDSHYYTENIDLLYTFFGEQSHLYKDGKMIAAMEVVVADNRHSLNINNDILVVNIKESVSVPLILHLALWHGDVNVTTGCITMIGQQAYPQEILLELLTCKNASGVPGFFMTLQRGHSDVITTFIQESAAAIDMLSLPEKEKAELLYKLLASKRTDGIPGFFIALEKGHTDAITTFIQESTSAIDALSLPWTQKAELLCELLASKRTDGIPGFFIALEKGHTDAITTFIQESTAAIDTLSLPGTQKAELLCELLACKNGNGVPGFFMVFQDGHTDAINAFIRASAAAIARLSLPKAEKAEWLYELLASKKPGGMPAFSMALQNAHPGAIIAFIRASVAAIAALPLLETQKTELLRKLLASKAANGSPGFCIILQEGHSDAITTFIRESAKAIDILCLPETQKAELLYELLASKRLDGMPGFLMTLQKGHIDAITAFIRASAAAITALDLLETQKTELLRKLLASKAANGLPGFGMTLQEGHSDAITTFIQESATAIGTLSLPETQKAELLCELLASKRMDGAPGFFMTLHKDHIDAITAFIRASAAAIDRFSLSKAEKAKWLYELLASKKANGTPFFFTVLQIGHPDVIIAFIRASVAAIAIFSLFETQKTELLRKLLASKSANGDPGFFMALQNDHSDAITVFIQESATAIDTLSLPETKKTELLCELLASKREDGTPGFFMCLQNGHIDAITAFIRASAAAIARFCLPNAEKAKLLCELLASKEADGAPGFFMTLQDGHTDAITVFIRESAAAIAGFSLPKAEKAKLLCELLASKAADGTPGFCMAMKDGYSDAITAFIQASAEMTATVFELEEERAELLYRLFNSMKNNKKVNFSVAMEQGGPAVNKAFTEGVDQLPLSARQKETLKNPTSRTACRII